MDMMVGPNPPTQVELRKHDSEWPWPGEPHRYVCVVLRGGTATIAVTGLPHIEIMYASPLANATAREDGSGKIIIEDNDLRSRATVCMGIGGTSWQPPSP